jgi:hypothetical protein
VGLGGYGWMVKGQGGTRGIQLDDERTGWDSGDTAGW